MQRVGVIVVLCAGLTACSNERRPDIPVQENFPPVGLASTAVWLDNRNVVRTQRPSAASIPTEDLCDIVDDCVSFASSGHQ